MYPQSMFWNKHKKNMYTPVHPSFIIIIIKKRGIRGYTLHIFLMELTGRTRSEVVIEIISSATGADFRNIRSRYTQLLTKPIVAATRT